MWIHGSCCRFTMLCVVVSPPRYPLAVCIASQYFVSCRCSYFAGMSMPACVPRGEKVLVVLGGR